jgi:hypothetical protein
MKQQTFDFSQGKQAAPDTSASKKGVMEILENDDSFDHHNSPDVSGDQIRDPS